MKYRVRNFAATTLFILCAVSLAVAQDLGGLAKQAGGMGSLGDISSLAQTLHLSPEQVQKVLPILQQELPRLQAIKGKPSLSDQQKVSQAKTVQKQSDSKLKPLLSPQQFLSLKNFRSQQLQQLIGGAIPH